MITIEYCQEGKAISDFEIDQWINNLITQGIGEFKISNSLPAAAIRLAILENRLKHSDVVIKFMDKIFKFNEYAIISDWPYDLFNKETEFCCKILKAQIRKMK
jgi:hypothetical protein